MKLKFISLQNLTLNMSNLLDRISEFEALRSLNLKSNHSNDIILFNDSLI